MNIKIELDAREQAGLDAQLAWYNAANPLDTLTAEGYIERHWVRAQLRMLADRQDPATTDQIEVLRRAVVADPIKVKSAVEADIAAKAAAAAQIVADDNP